MNINDRQLRVNTEEWYPNIELKVEDQIAPNDYERIDNYVKTYDNNEEGKNENRCDELHDDDSCDEEEEAHYCDVKRTSDKKVNILNESDKFKEKEKEKEKEKKLKDCDLLIDECVCNNLHNVCVCNLINEASKITQDEIRGNAKHWKDKICTKTIMKEKEIMKIDRQTN